MSISYVGVELGSSKFHQVAINHMSSIMRGLERAQILSQTEHLMGRGGVFKLNRGPSDGNIFRVPSNG